MDDVASRIRILLVDDHALVLKAMAAVMTLEPDFEVVGTALTLEDALRLTAETRPDIVVIDYRLPDGDGVAGTRQIRATAPDVAVVMLTGMDDPATRAEALDAGCAAFVAKGGRLDELARAVRAAAAARTTG